MSYKGHDENGFTLAHYFAILAKEVNIVNSLHQAPYSESIGFNIIPAIYSTTQQQSTWMSQITRTPYPRMGISPSMVSLYHQNTHYIDATYSVEDLIYTQREYINEKSFFGETPLLILCKLSISEDVKLKNMLTLIKYGADVNIAVSRNYLHRGFLLLIGL